MLVVFAILLVKMSEHAQPEPQPGIVTSDTINAKGSVLKKKLFIGTILGAIVVIGVVLAIFVVIYNHKSTSNTNDQAYLLLHPNQALIKDQTDLKNAQTPQEKTEAYDAIGADDLNDNQGANAVTAYQDAITADKSNQSQIESLIGLGYAYNKLGQNNQAISAFQQALSLQSQSKEQNALTPTSNLQTIIQRLQQGEPI